MGLSFLKGLVAAINPCAFVLLPTYLAYFLGIEGGRPGDQRSTILPLPPVPRELPDGWPYNVVTQIFAARTAGSAPAVAD